MKQLEIRFYFVDEHGVAVSQKRVYEHGKVMKIENEQEMH